MRKVCPILGGGAECFPVAYVWIISLDPLNFLFYKLIVGWRYSLPLFRRTVYNSLLRNGTSWNSGRNFGVASWGRSILWRCIRCYLEIRAWKRLKSSCHVYRPQIGAVAASDGHDVEQTAAWDTYRKNYVAEVTRNIAKLLSGRRGVSHDRSKKPDQTSFFV